MNFNTLSFSINSSGERRIKMSFCNISQFRKYARVTIVLKLLELKAWGEPNEKCDRVLPCYAYIINNRVLQFAYMTLNNNSGFSSFSVTSFIYNLILRTNVPVKIFTFAESMIGGTISQMYRFIRPASYSFFSLLKLNLLGQRDEIIFK